MAVFRDELTINWTSAIEKGSKNRYLPDEPWFCNKCERPWQGDKSRMIEYLANFPLIGCTHRMCPSCKNKGGKNDKSS
tara:strand:- start:1601 stop:1834 length:234 start_codon:yes stop_codon:yes gene_type:complete